MAKNYFKMEYEGIVITLPKSNVQFKNKYGIVYAKYYINYADEVLEYPLISVVDKRFRPVVNLSSGIGIEKADIVGNNLILLCKDNEEITLFQIELPNTEEKYRISVKDYEVLDDKTLILKGGFNNHLNAALYDVEKHELLTPFYNLINEFKFVEEFGEEVAETILFIIDMEDNYLDEIVFYINKKGQIVSSFKIFDQEYPMGTKIDDMIKNYLDNRLSR